MCIPAVEKPAKKLLKGISKVPKKAVQEVGKVVGLVDSKPDVVQAPVPTPEPVEPVEQMGASGGGVLTTAPRGKGVGRRTSFGARASLINLRNFDS